MVEVDQTKIPVGKGRGRGKGNKNNIAEKTRILLKVLVVLEEINSTITEINSTITKKQNSLVVKVRGVEEREDLVVAVVRIMLTQANQLNRTKEASQCNKI